MTDVNNQEDKKLALLIDSDNVSSKYLNGIFDELSQYGIITYRRIYGDFTTSANARWSDKLLEKSIIPIQQFSNTTGKNATDSALIIDAMDLLYNSNVDGFCIVSSDSDFTRLASRLRESGKMVIGMGEKKTPDSFRAACTVFTELENLLENDTTPAAVSATNKEAIQADIINIITLNDNKGKTTGSGEIGSKLQNKYPDFDIRTFGYSQLSKFLEDIPGIKVLKENNTINVALREEKTDEDSTVRDIIDIIKRHGREPIALSTLGLEIRKKHKNFNVKLYGYSQLYKFIDSIPGLTVSGDKTDRKVTCTR
ncbi:MAG TPA: NYN domain-containing protein [Lachnospiraceae bacterium]|nr:NYN domain-containing protein [Lachnospiraceae bacterium]